VRPRIEAEMSDRVGTLVGFLQRGTIANCSIEDANVFGRGDFSTGIGGLVGLSGESQVVQCQFSGSVQGYTRVGGVVGTNHGAIIECYTSGQVTAEYSSAGGVIGGQDVPAATALNCYSNCEVSGYRWIGGLVGANDDGLVSSCYSVGNVQGTTVVGGLIGGRVYGETEHSFWDVNTSGQLESAGGEGRTTAEMQMKSTFTDAGWDFVEKHTSGTWRLCEDGTSYPRLQWQSLVADFVCPDGVNFIDYSFFSEVWLADTCGVGNDFCDGRDLDESGLIDEEDLKILCGYWLDGI